MDFLLQGAMYQSYFSTLYSRGNQGNNSALQEWGQKFEKQICKVFQSVESMKKMDQSLIQNVLKWGKKSSFATGL